MTYFVNVIQIWFVPVLRLFVLIFVLLRQTKSDVACNPHFNQALSNCLKSRIKTVHKDAKYVQI